MADKINYEPRGDRVIVKRLARPEPLPGALSLPESQQKPLDEGIVIAVGPGNRNRMTGYIDEVNLKVGDHVCFLEYAGTDIEVDGEVYVSMRDEEIHGRRKPVTNCAVCGMLHQTQQHQHETPAAPERNHVEAMCIR